LACAVGGVALDNDDLLAASLERLHQERIEKLPDGGLLIEDGHDDRHNAFGALDARDRADDDRSLGQQEFPLAKHLREEAMNGKQTALRQAQLIALRQPIGQLVQRIGSPLRLEPDLLEAGGEQRKVQGFAGKIPAICRPPFMPVSSHQARLASVEQGNVEDQGRSLRHQRADRLQGAAWIGNAHNRVGHHDHIEAPTRSDPAQIVVVARDRGGDIHSIKQGRILSSRSAKTSRLPVRARSPSRDINVLCCSSVRWGLLAAASSGEEAVWLENVSPHPPQR
jgi:hypothetical protein